MQLNLRPEYVGVSFKSSLSQLSNRVKITYQGPRTHNFTVCFPPLHSDYNNVGQFVQTIELSKILGAGHFYVYNFSVGSEMNSILRWYQEENWITVLQFPLPILDTWYYGQMLAINDCIYRNIGTSKYVVISDTDEIIVPHVHLSWNTLLENVVKHAWQRDNKFSLDNDEDYNNEDYDEEEEEYDQEHSIKKKQIRRKLVQVDNFLLHKNGQVHHDPSNDKTFSQNLDVVRSEVDRNAQIRTRKERPSISRSDPHSARHLLTYNYDNNYDKNETLETGDIESQFASFSFRCAFFTSKQLNPKNHKDLSLYHFSDNELELFESLPTCPMIDLMRTDTAFEHTYRSKVILRPELVITSAIHQTAELADRGKVAYVEPEVALLHHYRNYKLNTCNTLDTSALVFKNKFYDSLKNVRKNFPKFPFAGR